MLNAMRKEEVMMRCSVLSEEKSSVVICVTCAACIFIRFTAAKHFHGDD